MVLEGGADAVRTSTVAEKAERREQPPEAAPATGEDAGPRGDGGVVELEKDLDKNVVGKLAEAVLAAAAVTAIGELGPLGGDLPVAVLHRAPRMDLVRLTWRGSRSALPVDGEREWW
jgi:hypothetical protein